MITSLRLTNFKNFADETLRMGPFTVIVGANASGKSNIRDAFRFLHGIGRGYRLADIIGGKFGAGGQVEWGPIRGATDEVIRIGRTEFGLEVDLELDDPVCMPYTIGIGRDTEKNGLFRVVRETLSKSYGKVPIDLGELIPGSISRESHIRKKTIFTSHPSAPDRVREQNKDGFLLLRMDKTGSQRKFGHQVAVRSDQPALGQINEHKKVVRSHKELSRQALDALASMRFLDLWPDRMRQGAFPGQTVLGDRGENLATVLRDICEDATRRDALVEWTRELTPMDVADFKFPVDPTTGRVQLAFLEANNRTISAYSASDGTLRFLAMLAALLSENPAGLYVFEEIDNGIHPSRLHLLLDLIEQQTAKGHIQVVTTTHSPELLSMMSDRTFENTSVVCRRPDTDDAVIRPIAELPKADELQKSQGLGRLHTGGWLETAVWFSEAKTRDQGSES